MTRFLFAELSGRYLSSSALHGAVSPETILPNLDRRIASPQTERLIAERVAAVAARRDAGEALVVHFDSVTATPSLVRAEVGFLTPPAQVTIPPRRPEPTSHRTPTYSAICLLYWKRRPSRAGTRRRGPGC